MNLSPIREPKEPTADYITRLRAYADSLEREDNISAACKVLGLVFLSRDKRVGARARAGGIEVMLVMPGEDELGAMSTKFLSHHLEGEDAGKFADAVLSALGRASED